MAQIHPTPKQAVEKTSHMIAQMKIMLSTKSKGISVRNAIKEYFLNKSETEKPIEFWNTYQSKKSRQANDILLKKLYSCSIMLILSFVRN